MKVKGPRGRVSVIPTKVGIQVFAFVLDSRLRGNDIFMFLCAQEGHVDLT